MSYIKEEYLNNNEDMFVNIGSRPRRIGVIEMIKERDNVHKEKRDSLLYRCGK